MAEGTGSEGSGSSGLSLSTEDIKKIAGEVAAILKTSAIPDTGTGSSSKEPGSGGMSIVEQLTGTHMHPLIAPSLQLYPAARIAVPFSEYLAQGGGLSV